MAGPHLHDQLARERDLINNGEAQECGSEHAGLTCCRATHPHELNNVTPHIGISEDADGISQLVQWTDPQVTEAERPAGQLPGQPKARPTHTDIARQLAHDIATGAR